MSIGAAETRDLQPLRVLCMYMCRALIIRCFFWLKGHYEKKSLLIRLFGFSHWIIHVIFRTVYEHTDMANGLHYVDYTFITLKIIILKFVFIHV